MRQLLTLKAETVEQALDWCTHPRTEDRLAKLEAWTRKDLK